MAKALGCYGELVTDVNEVSPAIKRAHETGKPANQDPARVCIQVTALPQNARVEVDVIACANE